MIERHGNLVLLVAAVAFIVIGLTTSAAGARVGLCALGAALAVLAVVLSRTEGTLKIGPSGMEAQLAPLRREAVARSEVVAESLRASGLELMTIAGGGASLADLKQPEKIEADLASLIHAVEQIDATKPDEPDVVPRQALREAAVGLMASGDWTQAAEFLDRYVQLDPDDWDAQFSRAVAHANTRRGPSGDLAALRAYSDAIALRPPYADRNLLARLFSYRGAMLKRLHRLTEAEADLHLAEDLATAEYERQDAIYNLACVYAMTNRREECLAAVRALAGSEYIGAIRANLHRYFDNTTTDDEFMLLLN